MKVNTALYLGLNEATYRKNQRTAKLQQNSKIERWRSKSTSKRKKEKKLRKRNKKRNYLSAPTDLRSLLIIGINSFPSLKN